jgi:hypothetical protein
MGVGKGLGLDVSCARPITFCLYVHSHPYMDAKLQTEYEL